MSNKVVNVIELRRYVWYRYKVPSIPSRLIPHNPYTALW
jgi:hypothetical protein